MIHDNFTFMRIKIYGKTEDKLTSLGVSNNDVKDPLAKLLLTGNKPEDIYNR